ncbi:MAG: YlxR family protein [Ruminococcaceae bacterium]|nr:YlxR family protein [Oscillospiraceae bacterium]
MSGKSPATGGKIKKIPMRQCLGCNEHKPKGELLRVVRSPEGEVSLDFTGKKSGRGAYICHSLACLKKVRKSRRLEHNLECPISPEVYDRMEAELTQEENV